MEADLQTVADEISQLKGKVEELKPKIARVKSIVKNQEREKTQLEFNISVLQNTAALNALQEKIALKKEELTQIEGHETAPAKQAKAVARKNELLATKAQLEGRYSEIMDRIRSLKVRTSS